MRDEVEFIVTNYQLRRLRKDLPDVEILRVEKLQADHVRIFVDDAKDNDRVVGYLVAGEY